MLHSSLTRLAPVFGIVLLGLTSAIFIACVGGSGEDSGSSSEDEICGSSSNGSSGYGGYGGYGYGGGYGYTSSSGGSGTSGSSGRPCR